MHDIWTSEAADFTPWLAREENLVVLAETLGIDLELEAQEKAIRPFRADILCKDTATGSWVLVENQLERTDHSHLGQLLTYASGLDAVTIVWIAGHFIDEHRSTLDWLNRITDERFRFFALEVELWRISNSPPAPKFNIVSKPNDWSRAVAREARRIDDSDLTETKLMQRDYWKELLFALNRAKGPVSGHLKAQPQSWMPFSIGRTGFNLEAAMNIRNQEIRADLYIAGNKAKAFFALLLEQKEQIEEELGYQPVWKELPARQDSRVSIPLSGVDPKEESDWPRQHEWQASKLNDLHRVFAQRIRLLEAED